eukprot:3264293-Heterocapsa_arctica.AAC.1
MKWESCDHSMSRVSNQALTTNVAYARQSPSGYSPDSRTASGVSSTRWRGRPQEQEPSHSEMPSR